MNAASDTIGGSTGRRAESPRVGLAFAGKTSWREFGFFLLVALVIAAINASYYFEMWDKAEGPDELLIGIVTPLLIAPVLFLAWAMADRTIGLKPIGLKPIGSTLPRTARLVLAVVAGATLAAVVIPHLVALVGLDFNPPTKSWGKEPVKLPDWLDQLTSAFNIAFYGALTFAVLEMQRRHRRTELAVDAERQEQAALARQLLESRLAAMQAQVEPQFLFDALVDIERLYARDPEAAARNLDRLIQYLRVALPRLRESGSTVQAEIELVESYLSVVQALHGGRPSLHLSMDRDCGCRTFYPMLLLPLIQRAVRDDATIPETIEIAVFQAGAAVSIVVRIATAALCAEDGELRRVRDRLHGLYGGRARLSCTEHEAGVSEFALLLPA